MPILKINIPLLFYLTKLNHLTDSRISSHIILILQKLLPERFTFSGFDINSIKPRV